MFLFGVGLVLEEQTMISSHPIKTCLFVCLFVCLLACLLACLLVCSFVCLFVCLFVWFFGSLFLCLFVCLLVFIFAKMCGNATLDCFGKVGLLAMMDSESFRHQTNINKHIFGHAVSSLGKSSNHYFWNVSLYGLFKDMFLEGYYICVQIFLPTMKKR